MSNNRLSACATKVKHTEQSAQDKIAFLENVRHRKVKGLRSYKCDYCDGWHLTSKPLELKQINSLVGEG